MFVFAWMPCSLADMYWYYRGNCWPHHQGRWISAGSEDKTDTKIG